MNILGVNYAYHDSSACILRDGELVVALEEERFTRNKHDTSFPIQSIEKCLDIAGLSLSDIDHVAFAISPTLDLGKKLAHLVSQPRHVVANFKLHFLRYFWLHRSITKWFKQTFTGVRQPQLHFVPHHSSHMAGSFFASPYDTAALLSLDGAGEWATASLGYGNGNDVTEFKSHYFPHSLGTVYEAITLFCGFKPAYDEGKTMGLAPLGNSQTYLEQARSIVSVSEEGELLVDFDYFGFDSGQYHYLTPKFFEVFGQPRLNGQDFEQHHLDVAAAFQCVLEEVGLQLARYLHERTQADYLVIAGGVSLNSVMNGRIVRESPFKDVYVMPAAGDNGTAIGAAYYVYNGIFKQPRKSPHLNPYLGTEYSNTFIERLLAECKLSFQYFEDIESETARILHQGNIIGWFQGRMEIGPRALGNRSILADPTQAHMKDKINAEVKHREAYRPFAPSVIEEARSEYFETEVNAPFMLKVCDVKQSKQAVLPAITHVDGSARLQTVHKNTNPRYHTMIKAFGELSGVPVVLNTSFNIMGEPVVESPIDAIRCFFSTGLDYLVIGNYVVSK